MSNTTDIVLILAEVGTKLDDFNKLAGLNLQLVYSGSFYDIYEGQYSYLDTEDIQRVLEVFQQIDWELPDCVCLMLDDDSTDKSYQLIPDQPESHDQSCKELRCTECGGDATVGFSSCKNLLTDEYIIGDNERLCVICSKKRGM